MEIAKTQSDLPEIFTAVKNNDPDQIQQLIRKNPSVLDETHDGLNPIQYAAVKGFKKSMETLLDFGCSIKPPGEYETSPLILAIKNGKKEIVSLFLDRFGIDICYMTDGGSTKASTAAHTAIECDQFEIFADMVKRGIKLEIQDGQGNYLLHTAARSSEPHALKLLIKEGANLHSKNNDNRSALTEAVIAGEFIPIVHLLREGVDPNEQDNTYKSPTGWAVFTKNIAILDLLLTHNGDPNQGVTKQQMPLVYFALEIGKMDIIERLVKDENINLNHDNGVGYSVLHKLIYSAQRSQAPVGIGGSLNQKISPMDAANLAQFFVSKGVDPMKKDDAGVSAWKTAKTLNVDPVFNVLNKSKRNVSFFKTPKLKK